MKQAKLSPAQVETLTLMTQGWELASSLTFDSRVWLQQGGAGRGGDTKRVNRATFAALVRQGLVEMNKAGFPTRTYKLTAKGAVAVAS